MYLAAFGLALIAAWALAGMLVRLGRAGAVGLLVLGLIFAILVLQRNGDWSTRTGLWERTVAVSPEMPRPRVNLALAYAKEERHAEALVHLETALRLQPNFAGAWAELGNIRKELGDLAAAEQAYRQALEFSPSLEGVYYNLGNVYQAAGRHAEAVAQYRETLSRDPEFTDAHNNLGQAFEQMGRADSARFQYRRALEVAPDHMQAWYNLAVILEREGKAAEARTAYMRARDLLDAHPDFAGNLMFQEFAARAQAALVRLRGNGS